MAEHQVMSSLVSHNSDLRNFVSQQKKYISEITLNYPLTKVFTDLLSKIVNADVKMPVTKSMAPLRT